MSAAPRNGRPTKSAKTYGFGFDPAQSPYHFAVVPDKTGAVTIVERFTWDQPPASPAHPKNGASMSTTSAAAETLPSPSQASEAGGEGFPSPPDAPKATLSPYLWGRVADHAAAEFNRRLRDADLKAGAWLKRETLLAPHFGKEIALLAWAVEGRDADPTPVPSILANWSGLAPEERWWFYTTVNATAGHADHGHDRGWRRAIKIALAENPVQLPSSALLVGPMPNPPRKPKRAPAALTPAPDPQATQGRLGLWDREDGTR